MMTKILPACALLALAASTAHADRAADIGDSFELYTRDMRGLVERGRIDSMMMNPAGCYADIDRWKKDGTKPDDLIIGNFEFFPGPAGGAYQNDRTGSDWAIPFSKAQLVCDRYAQTYALVELFEGWNDYLQMQRSGTAEELSQYEGNTAEDWDKRIAEAKECSSAVDAALAKRGVPGDVKVNVGDIGPLGLATFKSEVCAKALDFATRMKGEVPALKQKKADAIAAKFKAVGIKGKRLELFAYWDQEWYLPGCASSTADPKKLKKAKKLFQWVVAPDGQITIRKYSFKGDNYAISEKTTYSEDKAYKLCR